MSTEYGIKRFKLNDEQMEAVKRTKTAIDNFAAAVNEGFLAHEITLQTSTLLNTFFIQNALQNIIDNKEVYLSPKLQEEIEILENFGDRNIELPQHVVDAAIELANVIEEIDKSGILDNVEVTGAA